MIWNVIDRRTRPYRWKSVNVVIEAVEHDNSCLDADQASEAPVVKVIDHHHREGISIHEAVSWANQQRCPITLYIYDADEMTQAAHFAACEVRFPHD